MSLVECVGKRPRNQVCRDTVRRRKETDVMNDLIKYLPLQQYEVEGVTQCTTLKVALQYVKLKKMIEEKRRNPRCHGITDIASLWSSDMLKDNKKFLLVVDMSGTIMYASERITQLLGPLQVDAIGTELTDVVHQEDKEDVSQLLNGRINDRFILRMANNLSPHLKNPQKIQYKMMQLSIIGQYSGEGCAMAVLECRSLEGMRFLELTVNANMEYTADHDHRVLSVDWKFEAMTGYSRDDVIGQSSLLFVFPSDLCTEQEMQEDREKLMRDGVVKIEPYRLLNGFGDWHWVTTEVSLPYKPNGKSKELKCRDRMLGKYQIEYQSRNVPSVVDYSSLPSLSDLPTSNPPSVCSLPVCSRGEVSCSTEPLSDLSVEDVLGPPNDTSNDSGSHFQHVPSDQCLPSYFPSLPIRSNVTEDIIEILLH